MPLVLRAKAGALFSALLLRFLFFTPSLCRSNDCGDKNIFFLLALSLMLHLTTDGGRLGALGALGTFLYERTHWHLAGL